ncbi:MAG TPA: HNH endonuclease signature motif containing protein [Rubricoccaceae bacterium]|jgi:hypothetical protein
MPYTAQQPTPEDEWGPIDGMPHYEVSRDGRVRRLAYVKVCSDGRRLTLPAREPKGHVTRAGYRALTIEEGGRRKTYYVHRLVAARFVPNPDGKPEVNHIDGQKTNNRADNLEWCTRAENIQHAWETGLSTPNDHTGDRNPNRKLSEADVLAIRARPDERSAVLAAEFGVDVTSIQRVRSGRAWGHL